ncbi:MAG: 50S ribosomal protein L18 [Chlamydiae bacterium]|nr:50S ribosomal protein L18 [Chlamydiota bacterium]
MESELKRTILKRNRRAKRLRRKVRGNESRPRLNVVKSTKHMHVQLIDDESMLTLVGISTLSKEFRQTEFNKKNKASAKQLGLKIAELSKAKNVKKIIFDRGPYKYHGVLAAVADGAREGGLEF